MKNSIFILFLLISGLVDGQKHVKFYNSGLDKSLKGDYQGAILDFTKAIENFPKMTNAFKNRGIAKYELGDINGAISDFTKAIEFNPFPDDNSDPYNWRGICYDSQNKHIEAIADYSQAITLESNKNPESYMYDLELLTMAYVNRGATKIDLEDYDGGILDLKKAIEINPNYIDSYYNLGYAFFDLNDFENACSTWEKSVALGDKEAIELISKYCGH